MGLSTSIPPRRNCSESGFRSKRKKMEDVGSDLIIEFRIKG